MNDIKKQLKKCQPYFIEKDLIPRLYFKEDEKDIQYWIFFYSFVRRLSEEAISFRLEIYSRANIHKKLNYIIDANLGIINEFVAKQ